MNWRLFPRDHSIKFGNSFIKKKVEAALHSRRTTTNGTNGGRMKRIMTFAAACLLFAATLSSAPVKETVHVVIDNGPNAGTYNGETDRGGCSAGLTGVGSFEIG